MIFIQCFSEIITTRVLTFSLPQKIKFYNGSACRYPVVRAAAKRLGWKLVDEETTERAKRLCNVLWIDTSNIQNYFNTIQPWQIINHFPGMTNIARKTKLAENLELMKKGFKDEYDFFPSTYILPRDLSEIRSLFGSTGRSKYTFIVKPDGGCQGKGIFLTKTFDAIEDLKTTHVAQRYISNPLLIDGKKFDLRLYVLITSCDPLRIYLFKDGLVRLCTEDFLKPNSSNLDDMCMHLTNYSINKKSDQFEGSSSGDSGSKRSIKWLLSWLSEEKSAQCANLMWKEISEICVKTIVSVAPTLLREYRSTFGIAHHGEFDDFDHLHKNKKQAIDVIHGSRCFAVLGVDVMVDSDLKPHMIEVNHLPSFAAGSPLDEEIKSKVCYQALSALNCKPSDQCKYELFEKNRRAKRLHASSLRSNPQELQIDEHNNVNDKNIPTARVESHKNVEEQIMDIYKTYAPDKVEKVEALMKKYRGYEEWLVRRLEEKYFASSSNNGTLKTKSQEDVSEVDGNNSDPLIDEKQNQSHNTGESNVEELELLREYEVLVENGEYDRIYPPHHDYDNKLDLYVKMQDYANDCDEKEQKRLTCPMWLQRRHGNDEGGEIDSISNSDRDCITQSPSRGDWMFHAGNVHIQKQNLTTKIIQPPSRKQIEAAERLTKGYSVEDRKELTNATNTHKSIRNDSFIDKMTKAEEVGRQCRLRNETKYRAPKMSLQMKPINLEFANSKGNYLDYDEGERCYVDFAGRKIGMK